MTYAVHPYRRPIIGWPEDIQRMTLEDMKAFYRTYYSPNNAFIVAAGNFDGEEMLTKIRDAFGKIPRGPEPPEVGLTEPPQRGERRVQAQEGSPAPLAGNELPRAQRRPPGQLCAGRAGDDPVEGPHLAAPPGPGLRPAHRPLRLGRLPPGFRRPHHLQHRRPGHAGQGHRGGGGRHRRGGGRGPGQGRHQGGARQGQEPGGGGLHLRPGIQPRTGHEDGFL